MRAATSGREVQRRRLRDRLPLAVATALVVVGTVQPADAAVSDRKTFTVGIEGTDGAAPDVHAGDADAAITVTVTNTSSNHSLSSMNVTVPSPFGLVSAPADAVPGGPVVELRNLALRPGASTSVPIVVDVRSCSPQTAGAFAVSAKQSNDYSGAGNDFFLDAPSDLRVDVRGTCGLAFLDQPADAARGAAVTRVDFDPSAAPITVEIRDAGDSGRATSATATIRLQAADADLSPLTLQGGTVATSAGGIASFLPGPSLGVSTSNITLTASSSGFTSSAPSDPFTVVDVRVACAADRACDGPATTTKDGQSASISFGAGGSATDLLLSIDAEDAPAFTCAGYPRQPGVLVSQFLFTGDRGGDRVGTMTTTVRGATKPPGEHQVCWAAPYPFMTSSGAPAGVQGVKPGTDQALHVGLLPDCARKGTPTLPCVSARTDDRSTRTVAITVRTTGDDPWRY